MQGLCAQLTGVTLLTGLNADCILFLPPFSTSLRQVRVVQHKQTKQLYALKYINKARISKQRAVNNVIRDNNSWQRVSWLI